MIDAHNIKVVSIVSTTKGAISIVQNERMTPVLVDFRYNFDTFFGHFLVNHLYAPNIRTQIPCVTLPMMSTDPVSIYLNGFYLEC